MALGDGLTWGAFANAALVARVPNLLGRIADQAVRIRGMVSLPSRVGADLADAADHLRRAAVAVDAGRSSVGALEMGVAVGLMRATWRVPPSSEGPFPDEDWSRPAAQLLVALSHVAATDWPADREEGWPHPSGRVDLLDRIVDRIEAETRAADPSIPPGVGAARRVEAVLPEAPRSELADVLGVTVSTWGRWVNGRQRPSTANAARLEVLADVVKHVSRGHGDEAVLEWLRRPNISLAGRKPITVLGSVERPVDGDRLVDVAAEGQRP